MAGDRLARPVNRDPACRERARWKAAATTRPLAHIGRPHLITQTEIAEPILAGLS
jgi:hypothetical protein